MISLPKTKAGKTEYEEYFASDVLEKYQVTPEEFIDLKALMGDTSDNIPGIPGIGEKTASAIISKYKSLEEAIAHAQEIKPQKASRNLIEYADQGRMSKVLAAINTHSPVSIEIEDGAVESEKVFYNDASFELFKKLELNRLLTRFDMNEVSSGKETEFELKSISDLSADSLPSGNIGLYLDDDASVLAICSKDGKAAVYPAEPEFTGSRLIDAVNMILRSDREIYVFGLKKILHAVSAEDFRSENIFDLEIMAICLILSRPHIHMT